MKQEIKDSLAVLIGQPFVRAYRALDLDMFFFGKRHTIITNKGNPRELGEFALHVQCAWRVIGSKGIMVASRDRYYPADDSEASPDDFDWNQSGNRCDKLMEAFILKNADDDSLVVKSIEIDSVGGVKFQLAKEFEIDIFPDNSFADEHWRFFRKGSDKDHFVLSGAGIEGQ